LLQDAVRRAAEKYRLQAWRSAAAIVELEATRTFRLRRRILRLVRR
jgi:hypothetical protein